jgi:D-alanyl-D-alanine carboxypeptidase/D-alanyl-D-alanine-endopeptidase (penicillin-binding protein 4)
MQSKTIRRGLIAAACVAGCGAFAPMASAATGPVPGLDPAALTVMNQPAYANGQWFISVRDLATGEPLIALNSGVLVEPGSVVKTYSMGAGWLQFGADSKVVTPVKRNGRVRNGRLKGDLVLVGQGDLTMDGRTKPDGTVDFTNLDHNDANDLPGATLTTENPLTGLDKLAKQVRASGIRRVAGNVIVDDRLWETFELEPNGPVTPIIINNNLIDFTTTPTRVGKTAKIVMSPVVAPWKVTSRVRTVAAGGENDITVTSPRFGQVVLTGTIAAGSDPMINTYAFADPARFARTAFIEALQRAGVKVANARATAPNPAGRLPSQRAVSALPAVAELPSLSLKEEATYVLKVSYNRGAQTMICRLAVAAGSRDCTAGLAKAAQVWRAAGLDTDGAVLIDGSGLTGNLITADNEVQLQTIMAKRPDADAWRSTLPILGVDGSLATVQAGTPSAGHVFAKTGTLAQADFFNEKGIRFLFPAKALGGYMDAKSGRRLAFSIVAANSLFTTIEGAFEANDDVGKVAAVIQQSL